MGEELITQGNLMVLEACSQELTNSQGDSRGPACAWSFLGVKPNTEWRGARATDRNSHVK